MIAILDLPPGSSLSLDGCAPRVVRRDDFVGVSGVLSSGGAKERSEAAAFVHLVVVRGAQASSAPTTVRHDDGESSGDTGCVEGCRRDREKGAPTPAVGFLLCDDEDASYTVHGGEGGWIFARRYDPRTEEPSSAPVDSITASNLLRSIGEGSVGPQRVVPYERFVGDGDLERWACGTGWISSELLRRRRLRGGDKVVPGSYEEKDDGDEKKKEDGRLDESDGRTPSYPHVPCIDPESSSPGHPAKRGVHAGTRRYLSTLSPLERTALFLDPEPGSKALRDVLGRDYGGVWGDVLGDVQLSFLLFLHLGCLASFEHWRDLICMLSFAGSDSAASFSGWYGHLNFILTDQLSSVESDFFDEVEYSGDNFLLPALERLYTLCSASADSSVAGSVDALANSVSNRFNIRLSYSGLAMSSESRRILRRPDSAGAWTSLDDDDVRGSNSDNDEEEDVMEIDMRDGSEIDLTSTNDALRGSGGGGSGRQSNPVRGSTISAAEMDMDYDEDDEDGPTVVSAEEVEASLARSAAEDARLASSRALAGLPAVSGEVVGRRCDSNSIGDGGEKEHRQRFPLLFASIIAGEDVLMACARILDEKTDVSLVREAAAYLEEVEAKR